MEITIKDLWLVLKKSVVLVLVGVIVVGLATYAYTKLAVQKVYASSADYILLSKEFGNLNDKDPLNPVGPTVAELNNLFVVGGRAIASLKAYLMTEETMERILRYIGDRHEAEPENPYYILTGSYSPASLLGNFSFAAPEEEANLVFRVSCKAQSSSDSRILMEAFGATINERSEPVLLDVFYADVCNPPQNGVQVSPNVTRNVLIGCLIGAVVPYLACLLYSVFDTSVKREEDLKDSFEYPILGQIPHM